MVSNNCIVFDRASIDLFFFWKMDNLVNVSLSLNLVGLF